MQSLLAEPGKAVYVGLGSGQQDQMESKQQFSFGHVEFKTPISHLSSDVGSAV